MAAIGIIPIVTLLLIASLPARADPQFVIASWEYPADEFGQGIEEISYWENSTGTWLKVGEVNHDASSNIFDWEFGVGLRLRCSARINLTQINASDTTEGQLYIQHNIVVTSRNGTTVFTQQNFTYGGAIFEAFNMYFYHYDVVMEFEMELSERYTATIVLEIYW